MSLYGTRDAAVNFQNEVKDFMTKQGFIQGKYNPCTYWHPKRRLKTLVHGDYFITTGHRSEAKWFKEKLLERFGIKTKVIGMGPGEEREERVLNRILRVGEDGWEYEPDQRHAELIINALGLQKAKGVNTPCEEEKKHKEEEDAQVLVGVEAREFRGTAARAYYLAMDRGDIQYAVKEVCRGMANPKRGDLRKLRRLGRYLVSHRRVVTRYPWQGNPG